MVDIHTISVVIAAASVVIAAITLTQQGREANRARQAELFMQIYNQYNAPEFQRQYSDILFQQEWTDYDDFLKKYGPETESEIYSSINSVGSFFQGIGVLVKRKLIDISLVDDLMSGPILRFWEKVESVFREQRERWRHPQHFGWFEYLYDETKKLEQKHAKASR